MHRFSQRFCKDASTIYFQFFIRKSRNLIFTYITELNVPPPDFVQNYQNAQKLSRQNDTEVSCCVCGVLFQGIASLKKHIEQDHKTFTTHSCQECGLCYSSGSHLKRHLDNVSRQNPYRCAECTHSYPTELGLQRHMMYHDKSLAFICEYCSMQFSNRTQLNKHLRQRSLPREEHECPGCKHKFSNAKGLKNHLKIVRANKQFKCPDCDHSYSRQAHFSHHRKVHGGGLLKCIYCSKSF